MSTFFKDNLATMERVASVGRANRDEAREDASGCIGEGPVLGAIGVRSRASKVGKAFGTDFEGAIRACELGAGFVMVIVGGGSAPLSGHVSDTTNGYIIIGFVCRGWDYERGRGSA